MSLFPVLIVAALLAAVDDRKEVEFTTDTLEAVQKNVTEKRAVLVDVRSKEEWNKGHVKDSIALPIDTLRKGGDPKEIAKRLPKDKIIYTFCVVGMRAKASAKVLAKQGCEVRALKPGYDELVKAGFKKVESRKSE